MRSAATLRLAAGALALLALVPAVEWLSRPAPPAPGAPVASAPAPARGWLDALPASTVPAPSGPGTVAAAALPDALELDAAGQLVPTLSVRVLFDRYLRAGTAPLAQRATDLRHYLDAVLPASARAGAQALVTRYLAYAQAHDAHLAPQGLPTDPAQAAQAGVIARLEAWQQERARLRQQLLGMDLANAWFEGDDAQLNDALTALRRQAGLSTDAPDDGDESNRLRAARMRTAARASAEREEVAQYLANATTTYAHPQP